VFDRVFPPFTGALIPLLKIIILPLAFLIKVITGKDHPVIMI
jgi:hypothetical protein